MEPDERNREFCPKNVTILVLPHHLILSSLRETETEPPTIFSYHCLTQSFQARPSPNGDKVPVTISGLRLEPKEPSQGNPFIGYEDTMSVVYPDEPLRVVFFGYGLERLNNVSFVASTEKMVDCSTAEHSVVITQADSFIYTETRFVGIVSFPS